MMVAVQKFQTLYCVIFVSDFQVSLFESLCYASLTRWPLGTNKVIGFKKYPRGLIQCFFKLAV